MIGEIISIGIIVLIVGAAVAYIIRAKKKGQKCIGCPHSKMCESAKKGKCTCGEKSE